MCHAAVQQGVVFLSLVNLPSFINRSFYETWCFSATLPLYGRTAASQPLQCSADRAGRACVDNLFPGLQQRAVPAGAFRAAAGRLPTATEEIDRVERQRLEHVVGAEHVIENQRPHALEHVGRRQRPGDPSAARAAARSPGNRRRSAASARTSAVQARLSAPMPLRITTPDTTMPTDQLVRIRLRKNSASANPMP